ncbi:hypothetical protein RF11_11543 [Thelohanellus kitauei]|uniref:BPTI/Kunitz inhibitor domain-containing protein n=1 Tax=Thelohanellus kitauei TaxID=669202 RepID=A0A0C2M110_THEKT|nr:hypothetical protein RF11_11543 [Thelohanellus kitauei]
MILAPSKCFKSRHEGRCWFYPKSQYYYYDSESQTCLRYRTCGPAHADENKYFFKTECMAECASPPRVKTEECLKDWGDPIHPQSGRDKYLIAFNKYSGVCDFYMKREEYSIPKTFQTFDACEQYCLVSHLN